MYQTSDIRKGLKVEIDAKPYVIVDFLFVKPGKGQPFTRTKMKNLITGSVLERTYKTGETLAEADIEEFQMQFLYSDAEAYHCMNMETYDQVAVLRETIGDTARWLVEEMMVQVLFYKGLPVTVEVPNFVELEITYCEPGAKGNTAQGATKSATLSTGATVQVPLFVENNTWIKIDTRTADYIERVKK